MVCQCGGTWKGIKSKVGGEFDISLQALFTYLCDLCAFECAISPLILLFSTTSLALIFTLACRLHIASLLVVFFPSLVITLLPFPPNKARAP